MGLQLRLLLAVKSLASSFSACMLWYTLHDLYTVRPKTTELSRLTDRAAPPFPALRVHFTAWTGCSSTRPLLCLSRPTRRVFLFLPRNRIIVSASSQSCSRPGMRASSGSQAPVSEPWRVTLRRVPHTHIHLAGLARDVRARGFKKELEQSCIAHGKRQRYARTANTLQITQSTDGGPEFTFSSERPWNELSSAASAAPSLSSSSAHALSAHSSATTVTTSPPPGILKKGTSRRSRTDLAIQRREQAPKVFIENCEVPPLLQSGPRTSRRVNFAHTPVTASGAPGKPLRLTGTVQCDAVAVSSSKALQSGGRNDAPELIGLGRYQHCSTADLKWLKAKIEHEFQGPGHFNLYGLRLLPADHHPLLQQYNKRCEQAVEAGEPVPSPISSTFTIWNVTQRAGARLYKKPEVIVGADGCIIHKGFTMPVRSSNSYSGVNTFDKARVNSIERQSFLTSRTYYADKGKVKASASGRMLLAVNGLDDILSTSWAKDLNAGKPVGPPVRGAQAAAKRAAQALELGTNPSILYTQDTIDRLEKNARNLARERDAKKEAEKRCRLVAPEDAEDALASDDDDDGETAPDKPVVLKPLVSSKYQTPPVKGILKKKNVASGSTAASSSGSADTLATEQSTPGVIVNSSASSPVAAGPKGSEPGSWEDIDDDDLANAQAGLKQLTASASLPAEYGGATFRPHELRLLTNGKRSL